MKSTVKRNAKLSNAVDVVCKNLRNDSELFLVWQSSIAIAFYDEMKNQYKSLIDKNYLKSDEIIEIANQAAKNFLNTLIASEN